MCGMLSFSVCWPHMSGIQTIDMMGTTLDSPWAENSPVTGRSVLPVKSFALLFLSSPFVLITDCCCIFFPTFFCWKTMGVKILSFGQKCVHDPAHYSP